MTDPRHTAPFENRRYALLYWLRDCAAQGLPAPSNAEIAKRFGFKSDRYSSSLISELAVRGEIEVTRIANVRVITIVETGQQTGGLAGLAHAEGQQKPRFPNNYSDPTQIAGRTTYRQIEAARVESLRAIDRTPCRICNVRADIGCKHSKRESFFDDRTFEQGRQTERAYRAKIALRLGLSQKDVATVFDMGVGETARLAQECAAR